VEKGVIRGMKTLYSIDPKEGNRLVNYVKNNVMKSGIRQRRKLKKNK